MATKYPPQLVEDIKTLMDTGEYDDTTDILSQGVRLLARRREQSEHLRELLQVGIDQYERGEYQEFSQNLLDERWELALDRYKAEQAEDTRATS
jgi:Arc/MetJ-type ribon-helix-helix transcriptional regulator